MNKAIKGIALAGLSAMMSVSFFACDKEEEKQGSLSEMRSTIEKMYALGYTDVDVWYGNEGDGEIGGMEVWHETLGEEANLVAFLFESENEAKTYIEEEWDGPYNDGIESVNYHGKWGVYGSPKGVEDFCSSSSSSATLPFSEALDVAEKAFGVYSDKYIVSVASDIEVDGCIAEIEIYEKYDGEPSTSLGGEEDEMGGSKVISCLFQNADMAQSFYEEYIVTTEKSVQQKGNWVVIGDNQDWADDFVGFIE